MNKEDKKRLEELRGRRDYLQSQSYLMKKGLEVNEQELSRIVAVIAEYEAKGHTPSADTDTPLDRGEHTPPADAGSTGGSRTAPTEGEGQPQGKEGEDVS